MGVDLSIEEEYAGSIEELERIRSRVEGYLNNSLARGEDRYYLSLLGSQLGSDRVILEKITGKKLVSYIRDELGYEIILEGTHKNIVVVKLKETVPGAEMPSSTIPRYAGRFWAAFRVPLNAEGDRRYINLRTMAFSTDLDEVSSGEDEVREIEPKFIVQNDGSAAPRTIAKHIEEWLTEQRLDPAPFLIKRKNIHREDKSLLDAVIDVLSAEQLKRVHLPLDVVKVLKDQPD